MPLYSVPLVRETTEYEWARVEVEAGSEAEAIAKAISAAEGRDAPGDEIEWRDHGCGYGGFSISRTPNEAVDLIEDEP
ncbi:hypothetical protein [Falsiroseomonas sp. CW058]|uniref:hypothetical protein n=1 Tax=Falsiroseomonas sp. CW058 TaxID=3388664 RepID=UPI003D317997